MNASDLMREFLWYWRFKAFCEIKHPREGLRKMFRLLRTPPHVAGIGQPKAVPKKIWTFWAQGWDDAPPLVRACRDSWIARNPGWEVSSLTQEDISTYVTFGYSLQGKHLTYTNYSNILRVSVLARQGGVWADATTLCSDPLDNWLPPLMQSGFFAFGKPKSTLADWFLAAEAGHPLLTRWRDYEIRYWRFATREWRYFWPHYLFEYLIHNDREMRRLWEKTPRVSADGPYAAVFCFKRGGTPQEFLDILHGRCAPLHKLDWRLDVPERVLEELQPRLNKA